MIKSITRRGFVLGAIAFAALPAWAKDKLTLAAFPSNPPFEARNPAGEFEGFEVDIVRELAKRVGADLDIQPFDFQPIFAAVSSGRVDMAVSSISITPERLKNQGFLQPHYDGDSAIAVRQDSPIKSLTDLKGKTVSATSASTGERWLKDNEAKYGYQIKLYSGQQDMLMDLQSQRIDGVLSDLAGLSYSINKMKGMTVPITIKGEYQYAVMIRKGHPMAARLNDALGAMKKDGTMNQLHRKHFGVDAPAKTSTADISPMPQ